MAELEGAPGTNIESLVGDLNNAYGVYDAALDRATSLEAQATKLRNAAPKKFDRAIDQATTSLLALANSEELSIGGRELLEGVLQINQYKPSRVTWSGRADIAGTLSRFDALTDGTPALVDETARGHIVGGVITDHPVLVEASIAQGMGGLPQADITFGFRRIKINDEKTPVLSDEEEIITQSHRAFVSSEIGKAAIQGYLDTQKLHIARYACGHGERTNGTPLEALARIASQLISVTGVELNTTHIDAVVQEFVRHRADREAQDARRSRSSRRRPVLYR